MPIRSLIHCAPKKPTGSSGVLVLACGAIARELMAVIHANGLDYLEVDCLPASYHGQPEKIAPELRRRLARAKGRYAQIFLAYAECGTRGQIDELIADDPRLTRLPGAHCYEFFAGHDAFARMMEAEPGSFFLTDFLVQHFDRLVWRGLALDRYPQLLPEYFAHYTRVVYLAQRQDPKLRLLARQAAARLGLRCEVVMTGMGELTESLIQLDRKASTTNHGDQSMAGTSTRRAAIA